MAPKNSLMNREQRSKLPVSDKPIYETIDPGKLDIGYRKNASAALWVGRR